MTQKRAAILEILRASEGHLTADEIYVRAKQRYPGMVLATVYNNLHALEEAGLILHIKTSEGADYYDKTPHPHAHARCAECGRIFDVEVGDLDAYLRKHADAPVLSYELIVHSVCPKCRKLEN